jgi:MtrB/PioB family decaheme-associated outer membrane protein
MKAIMNTCSPCLAKRKLDLAVRSALLAMAMSTVANANENPAVAEKTQLNSSVEVGAGYVGNNSYKFGEYNGLFREGTYFIGNFDLSGGSNYTSEDPTRWFVRATDLGLDTRELAIGYGRQGSFWIGIGYDELRRNRSDTYQTPYLGVGSNSLTLPTNWIVPVVPRVNATTANARGLSSAVVQSNALIAGVPTAPTANQQATANAMIAADLPAFRSVDLYTQRKRTDFSFAAHLGEQWVLKADFRREDKNGLKPMGTITRQTGSDISAIIPDLIDQSTDLFDIGLNFTGERSYVQIGYHGSLFRNNVNGMTWQNWATLNSPNLNTMSSAPSNEFHQLNVIGGYNFSPTTRLVADAALGRGTQNETFLTDATTPVVPVSSAQARLVSKSLHLKFTSRPSTAFNVSATYKFDERDNRTPVNTYQFSDANQTLVALFPGGGVVAQNANANTPYSKRMQKFDVDADYRFAKGQSLKGGYQFQTIDRWCAGTWIDCADAATTKENALRFEYRNHVAENLTGRAGYERSTRTVGNYNENAFLSLVPFANVSPNGAPGGSTAYGTMIANGLNGWGPNSGINPTAPAGSALGFFFPGNNAMSNALYANENRISELPGMRRYNMADRDRDMLRTTLNWQPNEQWDLQGGVNFHKDNYSKSVYGLTQSSAWSVNLDANYLASEDFSANVFFTFESQRARSAGNTYTVNSTATNVNGFTAISGGCYPNIATRNLNNKIDPCLDWTADFRDRIQTMGITSKYKGLMADKLQFIGDLSVTSARSKGTFTGGNYVNNPLAVSGAPAGTVAAFYIPGTPLPPVTTKAVNLRVVADYAIDKQRAFRIAYLYSRLRSVDWAYDGMQYGGLAPVLPSNEQSPNYSVHAVGMSCVISFR